MSIFEQAHPISAKNSQPSIVISRAVRTVFNKCCMKIQRLLKCMIQASAMQAIAEAANLGGEVNTSHTRNVVKQGANIHNADIDVFQSSGKNKSGQLISNLSSGGVTAAVDCISTRTSFNLDSTIDSVLTRGLTRTHTELMLQSIGSALPVSRRSKVALFGRNPSTFRASSSAVVPVSQTEDITDEVSVYLSLS